MVWLDVWQFRIGAILKQFVLRARGTPLLGLARTRFAQFFIVAITLLHYIPLDASFQIKSVSANAIRTDWLILYS